MREYATIPFFYWLVCVGMRDTRREKLTRGPVTPRSWNTSQGVRQGVGVAGSDKDVGCQSVAVTR